MAKLIMVLLIALVPVVLPAKDIKICSDDDWFPYTFTKNGIAIGSHIDILKKAVKDLGYTNIIIDPLPWKRCLHLGKTGEYDAIISASYKDKRAEFAFYPPDAKRSTYAKGRIDQVEYVIVTKYNTPYEFKGDLSTIPQPLGVGGIGSSITKDLEKKGVETIETNTKEGVYTMLMMQRVKSISTTRPLAEDTNKHGKFKGKLKVHKTPLKTKSYHIIFSKKGSVNKLEREKIWESLEKVRSNEKFMIDTLYKYER